MDNEVRLNIKLSAEFLEKIKKVARKKQLTVSALTRLLLLNYVEECEKNDNKKGGNN